MAELSWAIFGYRITENRRFVWPIFCVRWHVFFITFNGLSILFCSANWNIVLLNVSVWITFLIFLRILEYRTIKCYRNFGVSNPWFRNGDRDRILFFPLFGGDDFFINRTLQNMAKLYVQSAIIWSIMH